MGPNTELRSFTDIYLFPFVFSILGKGDKIKEFPHSAPDSRTISFFKFISIEVGCGEGSRPSFTLKRKVIP